MYVGMTEKGLPVRKAQHLWHAKNGSKGHFYNAIRKYGADSFVWHVVEEWPDYFSALAAERKSIRILRPAYNLTEGGGGVKGLRHSSESKAKMSAAKKGKPSVWTHTPMPQYLRDMAAAARRAERGRPKPKLMKPVINLTTGEVYPSVTLAAEDLGVSVGSMSRRVKLRNGFKLVGQNV